MALMILAAVLSVWVFIQVIFVELDGRRQRLTAGNEALASTLSRIDLKVEQVGGAASRRWGRTGQLNPDTQSVE